MNEHDLHATVANARLSRRAVASRLGIGGVAGLLAAAGTRIGDAAVPPGATPTGTTRSIPFLFVQDAMQGTFTTGTPSSLTLSLHHAGHTVYFADHPAHETGIFATETFLAAAPFASANPPNAALAMQLSSGHEAVAILTLQKPNFDARTSTLTYQVSMLSDEAAASLRPQQQLLQSTADLPASFGPATLFIDAINFNVYNSGSIKFVNPDIVITFNHG